MPHATEHPSLSHRVVNLRSSSRGLSRTCPAHDVIILWRAIEYALLGDGDGVRGGRTAREARYWARSMLGAAPSAPGLGRPTHRAGPSSWRTACLCRRAEQAKRERTSHGLRLGEASAGEHQGCASPAELDMRWQCQRHDCHGCPQRIWSRSARPRVNSWSRRSKRMYSLPASPSAATTWTAQCRRLSS